MKNTNQISSQLLEETNYATGSVKIYSRFSGQIIFDGHLESDENFVKRSHEIKNAIRKAEMISYNKALENMRSLMGNSKIHE